MTFDYIMNRMLESVRDTVDKREGSIIYDALAPAAAELVKGVHGTGRRDGRNIC